MLSSDSCKNLGDARCLPETQLDASVSTDDIDLDLDIDIDAGAPPCLDLVPDETDPKSPIPNGSTCPDQGLKQFNSLPIAKKVIVQQPVARHRFSFQSSDGGDRFATFRPSISDISPMYRYKFSHEEFEEDGASDESLSTSTVVSDYTRRASYIHNIEDDLVIIDGQIAAKDSNVDPILCRLKRQQVVAGMRRKESSVATEMLEAEKVRFDRQIDIKHIEEEDWGEAMTSFLHRCFCCDCCHSRPPVPSMRQLTPEESILSSAKRAFGSGSSWRSDSNSKRKSSSL
ncbi:hypothetical protein EGW08_011105 [Elysia chlorotica]|uniref:Uncharacterized protein n=1 Tax=Elysia chlorotica TaxID=188477 RepID=A0A433THW8_ELYCH|nr:hypothetical protein EGW08_011105 [Elysia chlorotica]